MKQIPPIKAVMTPFPHSVASSEPVERAVALMTEHDIEHLPVVENGRPVGLITEQAAREAESSSAVRDARVSQTYVVELSEPLDVVLLQMARRDVDAALVVKDDRLAGVFTRTDACRCFADLLRTLFPRDHDDDAA